MPAEATPAAWALEFAQLLARSGWPGELPGSDEQQMRMRFDELLGDFAAIAADTWAISLRKSQPERTHMVVSQLIAACGSDKQRANLVMRIYRRIPRTASHSMSGRPASPMAGNGR